MSGVHTVTVTWPAASTTSNPVDVQPYANADGVVNNAAELLLFRNMLTSNTEAATFAIEVLLSGSGNWRPLASINGSDIITNFTDNKVIDLSRYVGHNVTQFRVRGDVNQTTSVLVTFDKVS